MLLVLLAVTHHLALLLQQVVAMVHLMGLIPEMVVQEGVLDKLLLQLEQEFLVKDMLEEYNVHILKVGTEVEALINLVGQVEEIRVAMEEKANLLL